MTEQNEPSSTERLRQLARHWIHEYMRDEVVLCEQALVVLMQSALAAPDSAGAPRYTLTAHDVACAYQSAPNWESVASSLMCRIVLAERQPDLPRQAGPIPEEQVRAAITALLAEGKIHMTSDRWLELVVERQAGSAETGAEQRFLEDVLNHLNYNDATSFEEALWAAKALITSRIETLKAQAETPKEPPAGAGEEGAVHR